MEKQQLTVHQVSYDAWAIDFQCQIGIADNPETEAMIKEMVEFWAEWEKDVKRWGYLGTFLRYVAMRAYRIQNESSNLDYIKEEFATSEGWCAMDGSKGILLISVDFESFDTEDLELSTYPGTIDNPFQPA